MRYESQAALAPKRLFMGSRDLKVALAPASAPPVCRSLEQMPVPVIGECDGTVAGASGDFRGIDTGDASPDCFTASRHTWHRQPPALQVSPLVVLNPYGELPWRSA